MNAIKMLMAMLAAAVLLSGCHHPWHGHDRDDRGQSQRQDQVQKY